MPNPDQLRKERLANDEQFPSAMPEEFMNILSHKGTVFGGVLPVSNTARIETLLEETNRLLQSIATSLIWLEIRERAKEGSQR